MLLLLASLLVAAPVDYSGTIQTPGTPLAVVIHVDDKTPPGVTVDIPAQKSVAMKTTVKSADGKALVFVLDGVPGEPTFNGVRDAKGFSGTFSQGGGQFPFSTRAVDRVKEATAILADLGPLIDDLLKQSEVPGLGVAVVVDGQVAWAKGFGLRDREKKLPVTADSLFMIGSTTKAFTNVLLGTLVDEKKLALDDKVREHLPAFRLSDGRDDALTLTDLASHGTGINRADHLWYLKKPTSHDQVLGALATLKADAAPNSRFIYNNWMYAVLGQVIEQKTGKSYVDALQERVLKPLGMTSTTLSIAALRRSPQRCVGYSDVDKVVTAVPYHDNPEFSAAGATPAASVTDMARWLAFQLGDGTAKGKTVLSTSSLEKLHSPVRIAQADIKKADGVVTYGYGWGFVEEQGHVLLTHNGGIDGFLSTVEFFPNDGLGIVVLQNSDHTSITNEVAGAIAERVLGLKSETTLQEIAVKERTALQASRKKNPDDSVPFILRSGTRPTRALAEFTGLFRHPALGDLVVSIDGGALKAVLGDDQMPLRHGHYDIFLATGSSPKAHSSMWRNTPFLFRMNIDGAIDGVDVELASGVDEHFQRVSTAPAAATLAKLAGPYGDDAFNVTVEVRGSELTLKVKGQPTYTLVHDRDLRFKLSAMEGFSAGFVVDDAGAPRQIILFQPNRTFRLDKKP